MPVARVVTPAVSHTVSRTVSCTVARTVSRRAGAMATVVGFALVLGVAPARAQVGPDGQSAVNAEALIRLGADLRREGRLVEALDALHRAYAAVPGPRAAALSGLLEQSLGRFADSEGHLAEALAVTDDPWIRRNRATLEPALADVRRHLGDLQVTGGEPGAEVVIDDVVRGTLPLAHPVRVAAGTVTLEVRARGFLTVTRSVSITSGTLSYERVNMVHAASVHQEVAETPSYVCARGLILRNGLCYARPGAVADPRTSALRWVGWIGLGVTVVATAAAAGLGLDGNSTLDGYVQDCGGAVAPTACLGRYDQVRGDLASRATTVNVLWGVAAVGAVAAAAGFILSATLGHETDTSGRPHVTASAGGVGVVW